MKYIVGQTYEVPTIELGGNVFVVLHEHIGDITGRAHQHVDLRFLSDYELDCLGWERDEIFACSPQPTIMRNMICQSEYIPIKHFQEHHRSGFMQLQQIHQSKTMNCGVCPHQGCDLTGLEPVKVQGQNALVCPCHGLTWSIKTGKMLKRIPRK